MGYFTRPITHPTVPKGLERVRICLHAGNTLEEVEGLLKGIVCWVESQKVGGGANLQPPMAKL